MTSNVKTRAGDPEITPELVREHGITAEEYDRVVEMLGRTPTFTEVGIVSALWSEHCSYKHSRPLLGTLPTKAPWVLQGPGENAGVISVKDGVAVAFKVESHNHPSAVEPYQGAATGVGGILRDVFTMGARPVALLNSLRFGSLDSARVRYLFAGVVKGIGDYGNCVGVPTVGGEVVFDPSYEGNPLVNAMCVGVLKEEELIRAVASGIGNPIIAVGARTGRDGIHGASFASEDLSEESESKRPRVQVGDPFTEKLLLEASLELIRSGHIVAIQDMGAAGLTSSSAEMAARGDVGVTIDVTRVPVREEGMTPYEILLSESQERMLVVAHKGREKEVEEILARWDLETAVIGEVIAEPVYRVTEGDVVVAEFPGTRLVTDCPTYVIDAEESPALIAARNTKVHDIQPLESEADPLWTLEKLLASPTIASKAWVWRQYDSMVRTGTVSGPGSDSAVIRLRDTDAAVALSIDGNGRYVALEPNTGGMIAVCEAARNVACSGGRPRAITNNLNFGNPKKPEVYFQLKEAVAGIAKACSILETPVTGGNVSLYNENPQGAIHPTPTIGMVGVVESPDHVTTSTFSNEGDDIVLFGNNTDELGASEYLQHIHGIAAGAPPACNPEAERKLIDAVLDAISTGKVNSAHDCSDGGLAVALTESAISSKENLFGFTVDLSDWSDLSLRALLFGEAQGRVVISSSDSATVLATAEKHGVPAKVIGKVTKAESGIEFNIGSVSARSSIEPFVRAFHDTIPAIMNGSSANDAPVS